MTPDPPSSGIPSVPSDGGGKAREAMGLWRAGSQGPGAFVMPPEEAAFQAGYLAASGSANDAATALLLLAVAREAALVTTDDVGWLFERGLLRSVAVPGADEVEADLTDAGREFIRRVLTGLVPDDS